MHWQDIILTVGQFIINAALLPTVLGPEKPALSTCVLSAIILGAYTVVWVTLGLWFAASMVFVSTVLWVVLTIQQLRRRHTRNL